MRPFDGDPIAVAIARASALPEGATAPVNRGAAKSVLRKRALIGEPSPTRLVQRLTLHSGSAEARQIRAAVPRALIPSGDPPAKQARREKCG